MFSADPRVTRPVPAFRDGAPAHLRADVEVAWAGYAAGLAIGVGRSAGEIVAVLAARRAAAVASVETIAYELYDAVARAQGVGAAVWWRLPSAPAARLEEFPSELQTALGNGAMSLRAWRDAVIRRRPLPGRTVVLTFDDGYADFDVHARPILERHGFTASLFVVTDRAGDVNARDSATEEIRLMDWETLRRLDARGFEIGAHTATHPPLAALDDAQVVREVARSRQTLAERLGRSPVVFAAPYGSAGPGHRRVDRRLRFRTRRHMPVRARHLRRSAARHAAPRGGRRVGPGGIRPPAGSLIGQGPPRGVGRLPARAPDRGYTLVADP